MPSAASVECEHVSASTSSAALSVTATGRRGYPSAVSRRSATGTTEANRRSRPGFGRGKHLLERAHSRLRVRHGRGSRAPREGRMPRLSTLHPFGDTSPLTRFVIGLDEALRRLSRIGEDHRLGNAGQSGRSLERRPFLSPSPRRATDPPPGKRMIRHEGASPAAMMADPLRITSAAAASDHASTQTGSDRALPRGEDRCRTARVAGRSSPALFGQRFRAPLPEH